MIRNLRSYNSAYEKLSFFNKTERKPVANLRNSGSLIPSSIPGCLCIYRVLHRQRRKLPDNNNMAEIGSVCGVEGDTDQSLTKKRKLEDQIFAKFRDSFLKEEPGIIAMLDHLKSVRYAVAPLEIKSCNAADPALGGVCFTKATCAMIPKPQKIAFANFFIDGFKILKKFLKDAIVPEDEQKKKLLSRLLKFLMDKDIQAPLKDLTDCGDETELSVLSGFHLFSQLSASPAFTIDNSKSNKIKWCPCGKRHAKTIYGDNSLGDPSVWHGHIDLIMEGAELPIGTLDNEEYVGDVESVIEGKKSTFQLDDISPTSCVAQIAAKTIVYSFFYRKLHPEKDNSLIPCVCICKKGLIFYFYDSVNDVMLGSTIFYLNQSVEPKKLNYTAVFALWLVLNHKHFCDGSSCTTLPKSGFSKFAEKKIDIYKNDLRRGDVPLRYEYSSVDPLSFETADFLVAKELEEI